MGTEELRAAVLREATAEATALIEAATVEASQLVDSQKRQLEERVNARVAEHRAARDREVATNETALKIESRNAVLKRKQELLEGLYLEAEERVRNDDVLYHAYLERAVLQIGQQTPESIECRRQDEPIIGTLLAKRRDGAEVRIDAKLPDDAGGLIVHFAEAELDLTLSAASTSLRESTLVQVAQVLFGDKR